MNKEKLIELNLNDILGYVKSTLLYLENKNNNLDKEEIIMYLKSVSEIINETKKLLIEIELERNCENE